MFFNSSVDSSCSSIFIRESPCVSNLVCLKSLIKSYPLPVDNLKISFPFPPINLSYPYPPTNRSLPLPPFKTSMELQLRQASGAGQGGCRCRFLASTLIMNFQWSGKKDFGEQ